MPSVQYIRNTLYIDMYIYSYIYTQQGLDVYGLSLPVCADKSRGYLYWHECHSLYSFQWVRGQFPGLSV